MQEVHTYESGERIVGQNFRFVQRMQLAACAKHAR